MNAFISDPADRPRPILVTGSHRSGSTWVAHVLSAGAQATYVHEPLNIINHIPPCNVAVDHWYTYICEENSAHFCSAFTDLIEFRYPLSENLSRIRSGRDLAKLVRDQSIFWRARAASRRPLIKDPFAVFSCEWFYRLFFADVVLLVRHPAAFCSSLKTADWHFPFEHFLRQKALMRDWLDSYADQIEVASQTRLDLIDQGILLWNCVHHAIATLLVRHPDWICVRHEDLSREPTQCFATIFDRLGLSFSDRVIRKIQSTTGDSNPIEQVRTHSVNRDSRGNVRSWEHRLTREEIERIRAGTAETSMHFYDCTDW